MCVVYENAAQRPTCCVREGRSRNREDGGRETLSYGARSRLRERMFPKNSCPPHLTKISNCRCPTTMPCNGRERLVDEGDKNFTRGHGKRCACRKKNRAVICAGLCRHIGRFSYYGTPELATSGKVSVFTIECFPRVRSAETSTPHQNPFSPPALEDGAVEGDRVGKPRTGYRYRIGWRRNASIVL